MKFSYRIIATVIIMLSISCNNETKQDSNESGDVKRENVGGQENIKDDESQKDVVKVAVGSENHKTLVAALKQAELVTALSNAGPFTVFAPTDEAFSKVDKSTLDALMEDKNKSDLQNILQYHVTLSAIKAEQLQDGQSLGMVNGDNLVVTVKDGQILLNNSAKIIASVPASNGIVHVIDAVLLPPTKK